jgi:murein DD-endopeptidase MepM/ murein hydrolase activator NlpD
VPTAGRPRGPLDDLPRPLSERARLARRGRVRAIRRIILLGAAATLAAAVVTLVPSWLAPPLGPAGEVQGAVESAPPTDRPGGGSTDAGSGPMPSTVRQPGAPPTATPEPTAAPPETLVGYRWPLPKGRLTLPFGPSPWGSRVVDGESIHDGLDLATFCGDRIVAAHDGTVLAAGRHFDRQMGWIGSLDRYVARLDRKKLWSTLPIVVVVDDGNGYRSVYAHFGKIVVGKGETVRAGDLLGYEGATGRASGCHLHYGLFSPLESARFEVDPDVVKRMKVPRFQIARVDPLRVLPERARDPEPWIPTWTTSPAPAPTPTDAGSVAR